MEKFKIMFIFYTIYCLQTDLALPLLNIDFMSVVMMILDVHNLYLEYILMII